MDQLKDYLFGIFLLYIDSFELGGFKNEQILLHSANFFNLRYSLNNNVEFRHLKSA